MARLAALALLVSLAACARVGPVPPSAPVGPAVPAAASDTCGAARHAGLIGRDATALERVLILGPVRLIRPGQSAEGDGNPARINFEIDGGERIARIYCA